MAGLTTKFLSRLLSTSISTSFLASYNQIDLGYTNGTSIVKMSGSGYNTIQVSKLSMAQPTITTNGASSQNTASVYFGEATAPYSSNITHVILSASGSPFSNQPLIYIELPQSISVLQSQEVKISPSGFSITLSLPISANA